MSADGRIAEWNERSAEMFGWSREEALGRNMAELIIPERYREAHNRGLRRFLETGEEGYLGQRIELPGLHRRRGEFPVELRISPVELDGGTAFVGCLRDVSGRRALQQELLESERQFGLMVNAITDCAIYMLNPEGRVTTWNSGAGKGLSRRRNHPGDFSRFFSEDDQRAGVPKRMLREEAGRKGKSCESLRVARTAAALPRTSSSKRSTTIPAG